MPPLLRLDRGTLVMWEVPDVVSGFFTWDPRSQSHRAPGQAYRDVMQTLREAGLSVRDEAAAFSKLDLGYARDIEPYRHQKEALAAWKRSGRRGVVESTEQRISAPGRHAVSVKEPSRSEQPEGLDSGPHRLAE